MLQIGHHVHTIREFAISVGKLTNVVNTSSGLEVVDQYAAVPSNNNTFSRKKSHMTTHGS